MSTHQKHLALGAFIQGLGHHLAAWRHPEVNPNNVTNIEYYKRLAKLAEKGKFDLVFFADSLGLPEAPAHLLERGLMPNQLDPVLVQTAVAGVTEKIGLVATVSTTYLPPYHLARKFASLDHISGGRAAWNLVTSGTEWEAKNFNLHTQIPHAERYRIAQEYLDVVTGLWDSWEDGAFVFDKAQGRLFDADKLHVINHNGAYYQVRGPLAQPRSPQGYPVIVQAGSSDDGQELAAASAEVVFTAQQTFEEAKAFYESLKSRLDKHQRSRDSLKIMPGILPIIGRTESEAQEKFEQLQNLIDPVVGLGLLSAFLGGVDLSQYDLDASVPDFPQTEGWQSRQKLFIDLARRENLTLRQLYLKVAGARGHRVLLGTPATIADQLEHWFINGAADGFNILAPIFPSGLTDFIDGVIPELQRRGLFRREYSGNTLREHLGLSRPVHPFQSNQESVA